MISITLGYPPTANTYWRNISFGGKPRTLISREGRDYKKAVALLAKQKRLKPMPGPVRLVLRVYRPRRTGDLDNIFKPLLDALKGYAFEDDSQVIAIEARRFDDKKNPRAEVEVWPASELTETDWAAVRAETPGVSP